MGSSEFEREKEVVTEAEVGELPAEVIETETPVKEKEGE